MAKGGALVWIEMVACKFATGYMTNGVNEVPTVEVFEPILIRVMGVGTTVEVVRWRVLTTFLIASVLGIWLAHVEPPV